MTLQQLIGFISVAKTKNFSNSAKILYLSQPALSNQIKALEKEMGYELLSRTTNGIELTEAGEVFLQEAKYIIGHYEKVRKKLYVLSKRNDKLLRIGYTDSHQLKTFMPFLSELRSHHEAFQLELKIDTQMNLLHALKDKELDLVIAYNLDDENTGFSFYPLFPKESSMRLAMSKNHRLAQKESCSLLDLNNEDILWVDRGLAKDMFEFEKKAMNSFDAIVIRECPSLMDALTLSENGFGVTLIPDFMMRDTSSLAYVKVDQLPAASFGFYYDSEADNLANEIVKSLDNNKIE